MSDVEKVKKDLRFGAEERCLKTDDCEKCEYYNQGGNCYIPKRVMTDALSVIEEQQEEIKRLQPKKGHWEMKEDPYGFFDEIPVCSECGCTNKLRKKTAFCDHCGADMREGDGE